MGRTLRSRAAAAQGSPARLRAGRAEARAGARASAWVKALASTLTKAPRQHRHGGLPHHEVAQAPRRRVRRAAAGTGNGNVVAARHWRRPALRAGARAIGHARRAAMEAGTGFAARTAAA